MWSQDTINMFTGLTAVISPVAIFVVTFLFHQGYRLYAKAKSAEMSATTLSALDSLAKQFVLYAQEQFDQWAKSKGATPGPTNGTEKKALAMQLMKEQAPAGVKFTEAQASVAIDAAVQAQRQASIAPPAMTGDVQGTVYASIKPGAPAVPNLAVTP
jgi:hypothetical protein